MVDEGHIKFRCKWIKTNPITKEELAEINYYRSKLYKLGFIGAYSNGIGFGNISIRLQDRKFIISGSKTGAVPIPTDKHYTMVTEANIEKNELTCKGPIVASSESMTHAALYEADKDINAVIHIHSSVLWNKLLDKVPTTEEVPYGTPEMALEIHRLFKESDIAKKKILVMSGHEGGIVSFGEGLNEAYHILLKYIS